MQSPALKRQCLGNSRKHYINVFETEKPNIVSPSLSHFHSSVHDAKDTNISETNSPSTWQPLSGRYQYRSLSELSQTNPSRRDGLSLEKEVKWRRQYVRLIQESGIMLKLPQWCIAVAVCLCHRFFAIRSMKKNDRFLIATACLFLAAKTEDVHRKAKEVIEVSERVRRAGQVHILNHHLDDEIWREKSKEELFVAERAILYALGFDLQVSHPYTNLLRELGEYGLRRQVSETDSSSFSLSSSFGHAIINNISHSTQVDASSSAAKDPIILPPFSYGGGDGMGGGPGFGFGPGSNFNSGSAFSHLNGHVGGSGNYGGGANPVNSHLGLGSTSLPLQSPLSSLPAHLQYSTVLQQAWNFVNDSLKTTVSLQFKPSEIAGAAIWSAQVLHVYYSENKEHMTMLGLVRRKEGEEGGDGGKEEREGEEGKREKKEEGGEIRGVEKRKEEERKKEDKDKVGNGMGNQGRMDASINDRADNKNEEVSQKNKVGALSNDGKEKSGIRSGDTGTNSNIGLTSWHNLSNTTISPSSQTPMASKGMRSNFKCMGNRLRTLQEICTSFQTTPEAIESIIDQVMSEYEEAKVTQNLVSSVAISTANTTSAGESPLSKDSPPVSSPCEGGSVLASSASVKDMGTNRKDGEGTELLSNQDSKVGGEVKGEDVKLEEAKDEDVKTEEGKGEEIIPEMKDEKVKTQKAKTEEVKEGEEN